MATSGKRFRNASSRLASFAKRLRNSFCTKYSVLVACRQEIDRQRDSFDAIRMVPNLIEWIISSGYYRRYRQCSLPSNWLQSACISLKSRQPCLLVEKSRWWPFSGRSFSAFRSSSFFTFIYRSSSGPASLILLKNERRFGGCQDDRTNFWSITLQ